MKKGLVSCLLCTYNAEAFIDATLSSMTQQTYEQIEILIRDDASNDGTVERLKHWKQKEKRMQIFFETGVKR
jgi:glycosyltransferase involved in cell wall biosynthesis